MFRKTPAFRVFFWFFTVLIGGFIFLPLLWMINTALKPTAETFSLDFFTGTKTLENIVHIVTDEKIMRYLRNSLVVSFGSSLMATIVCAFAAYSFSKFRYRGRKLVMGLFMMSQAFPQAILLLSIYVLMQKTGLLGSYWALLISYVVFTLPVGTWTLKSYFDQLPDSLIESARIDGAGNLKIMFQIVFPITIPGMISIAIYGFVWSWNDLLYSIDVYKRQEVVRSPLGAREGYNQYYLLEMPDGTYILAQISQSTAAAIEKGEHVTLPVGRKVGMTNTARSYLSGICKEYGASMDGVLYTFDDGW